MNVEIVRTTGVRESHEVPKDRVWSEIERLIGASMTCNVNLRDGRVMVADDNGYETTTIEHGDGRFELKPTKARKPVNPEATKLYHAICVPGTTHQIVGDVAIVRDEDFA